MASSVGGEDDPTELKLSELKASKFGRGSIIVLVLSLPPNVRISVGSVVRISEDEEDEIRFSFSARYVDVFRSNTLLPGVCVIFIRVDGGGGVTLR